MADDFDFVSDLNDGTADVVRADDGNVAAHGEDAVQLNGGTRQPLDNQVRKIDDTPKPAADKPRSLRDTISDAIKADVTDPTPDNALQDGRKRDPVTGLFVEKTAEEKAADAALAANPAPVVAPAAPVLAAPQGIDAAVFSSLPAETQAQLARTMEDVSRQQQRFAVLAPIEQLVAPRFDGWAMNGMSPQVALHQLLALSDFAGRDIGGFIKYMAQTNNVDLADLVLGMDGEEVDPQFQALDKRLAAVEVQRTQDQQRQVQAIHDRTVDAVIEFTDEKGPDGNVLRPYLSELGDAWSAHIQMVKAQNPNWPHKQVMQQAYDNACWTTESIRAKMQSTADKAAEAERLRTQAARVEAARTASATVRSGVPTSAPPAPNDGNRSLRDTIRGAMAQHT